MLNEYFTPVSNMLLEHYDNEETGKVVFSLDTYLYESVNSIRFRNRGYRLIIYQLEQLTDSNTLVNTEDICNTLREADEIWDYDLLNIRYLDFYKIQAKFVPMRYSVMNSSEFINKDSERDIDILFYGVVNDHRSSYITKLTHKLYPEYNCAVVSNFSIGSTDKFIDRSKVIVNLHQFSPYARQEQVRISYLLTNSRCVVSEWSQLNYFGLLIDEFNEDSMIEVIKSLLDNDQYKVKESLLSDHYKALTYSDREYDIYRNTLSQRSKEI